MRLVRVVAGIALIISSLWTAPIALASISLLTEAEVAATVIGRRFGYRETGHMPNRRSGYRSRVLRTLGLGTVALLLGAVPVGAHNQLFPPPLQDYVDCLDTNTSPCVEWPKTWQNLSVNVDVYLSYTLAGANIDLRPDIRAVFPKWNEIDARNPHLQETTSTSNEELWVARADIGAPNLFARTYLRPSCVDYQEVPNWACAAPGYKIYASKIIFNSTGVTWNHSYSFGCNSSITLCWGDSRWVATHEFGHMEGLAHVHPGSNFASVMKSPVGNGYFPTSWWPNSDDHAGIIAIYGAYP